MYRRIWRTVAALAFLPVAGALVAGAGWSHRPTAARAQEAEPSLVAMSENRFHSDYTIVYVGDTVTFRNDETDPRGRHDVQAVDGSFSSPVILPGESWSFTFAAEGYYAYYCSFHENMEGAVLVVYPE